MPSFVVTNRSGGDILLSGNPYSGSFRHPQGGIQLKMDKNNSGNVYVSLSGGCTITSGGMWLSGGALSGMLDGTQLGPGDAYFVPLLGMVASGQYNLFFQCDQACSGQARVYFEPF